MKFNTNKLIYTLKEKKVEKSKYWLDSHRSAARVRTAILRRVSCFFTDSCEIQDIFKLENTDDLAIVINLTTKIKNDYEWQRFLRFPNK